MSISQFEIDNWCENHFEEHFALLQELAAIPAPSHHEHLRAEYIQHWLLGIGAENVFVDEALNVVYPHCCENEETLLLCLAHTDVVFPDLKPLPIWEENGKLYAPGVGDDTANVVAMMLCIKFLLTHPHEYNTPTLFVFNSCEEGLGNLKGVRKIMADYAGRIQEMVSFDLQWDAIISRAVGSERWEIEVTTQGGHSYGDFGRNNAIHHLSELVCTLYQQQIPQKHNTKTTFNVGTISGGTSVNTIAQSASITYEYRSDDLECLKVMADQFYRIVEDFHADSCKITKTSIGIRPCSVEISAEKQQKLIARCSNAVKTVCGYTPVLCSGSTDANIPLSMGIPAVTFGLYQGGGAHTRQEYVEIKSLTAGLKIALTFLLDKSILNTTNII